MKNIHFSFFIAIMAFLLSGCGKAEPEIANYFRQSPPIPMDYYFLHISFKDVAGNDLVAPWCSWGDNKDDNYSLVIKLPDGTNYGASYFTLGKFDNQHSIALSREDETYREDGSWYLVSNINNSGRDITVLDSLTYMIQCPLLFGDRYYHNLNTWWKAGEAGLTKYEHYSECVKATFEGKEVSLVKGITYNEKSEPSYIGYFIDIVLVK